MQNMNIEPLYVIDYPFMDILSLKFKTTYFSKRVPTGHLSGTHLRGTNARSGLHHRGLEP